MTSFFRRAADKDAEMVRLMGLHNTMIVQIDSEIESLQGNIRRLCVGGRRDQALKLLQDKRFKEQTRDKYLHMKGILEKSYHSKRQIETYNDTLRVVADATRSVGTEKQLSEMFTKFGNVLQTVNDQSELIQDVNDLMSGESSARENTLLEAELDQLMAGFEPGPSALTAPRVHEMGVGEGQGAETARTSGVEHAIKESYAKLGIEA